MRLNQTEFGKLLGVNISTVCRWERGKTEPSYKDFCAFVDFCKERDMDIHDLRFERLY